MGGHRAAVVASVLSISVLTVALVVVVVSKRNDGEEPGIHVITKTSHVAGGQVRVLEQVINGFADVRLARVEIGVPPFANVRPGGDWISYYAVRRQDRVERERALWQAYIATGILQAVSQEHAWPSIRGYSFVLLNPDGSEEVDEAGSAEAFKVKIVPSSKAQLTSLIQEGAKRAGLALVEVRFSQLLGHFAVDITVQANDPRAILRSRGMMRSQLYGSITHAKEGPRVEGVFVVVRDRHGVWITASGYAVREGSTTSITHTS